jgi:DNA-binding NarL/FixJ family response regulator
MKRITVLVVDDEDQIRNNITEYLEEFGYKTIQAENGAKALQLAITAKPDIILCDIDMPEMNGHEFYKKAQQVPELALIPFIFLTAKSSTGEMREGMLLGADDYITKPFKLNDVLMSLNKRLEKVKAVKDIANDKLNALTNNAINGVFFIEEGEFTFANNKLTQIMGKGISEIKSMPLEDFITGGERSLHIEKINACIAGITDSLVLETFISTNTEERVKRVIISLQHLTNKSKKSVVGVLQEAEKNTQRSTIDISEAYNEIISHLKKEDKEELAKQLKAVKGEINADKMVISNYGKKMKISQREMEVLELICKGFTNAEIANKLFLSDRTVEKHLANLRKKTNTKNTAQLVAFSVKNLGIDI